MLDREHGAPLTGMAPEGKTGESKPPVSQICHSLSAFATSIGIQPTQQGAHASPREGNRAISRPVIDVDRVAVGVHRISTGEDDIVNVAMAFVLRFRPENPRIAPQQALFRILEIEQGQT